MGNYGKGMDLAGELRVDKGDFEPGSLDDELRVDRLCQELLMRFYFQLVEEGTAPVEATRLANGADYFIRDFVVAIMQCNIFDEKAGIVRQFAGNWYIVNTLDPDIQQLASCLQGVREFYRFLHGQRLISADYLRKIEVECADIAYYDRRIESFWEITGDGYFAWERECTLKNNRRIE